MKRSQMDAFAGFELKRIKEIKKVYQALKNYGFKLEDEKDFEEKFSKILRKYLEG